MTARTAMAQVRETLHESGLLWTASIIADRVGLGVLDLWRHWTVSPEMLFEQAAAIFRAWRMPEDQIAITVRHLLYADLRGIDSHGCAMLASYHRGLVSGTLTMRPKIDVVNESGATAVVDGGGGLGHAPGDLAMKLAIEKCRVSGVGAVAVRNSGHYGAAGAYASLALESGFIGIATTNTAEPAVVPTLGTEAKLGTNPIAFAAPAARHKPFLLDMATSTAPVGKLMTAWRSGRSIPAGWALDPEGTDVTNPRLAAKYRRLTPLGSSPEMGSHKGYGLAAMVEILSSVLTGGPARGVGHFFLALDPRRFGGNGEFEAGLDGLIDALRGSTPMAARQPVLVAGDPEYAALAERSRSGIPVARAVVEDIRRICRSSGAPFLLTAS